MVPVAARAQDAPGRGDVPIDLPPVEVVADRPQGSLRAPGSDTTVVEAGKFGGEGRSVAELLGTSPGVAVHALGGPGEGGAPSPRGAPPAPAPGLLGGVPPPGPGGGAGGPGTN